MATFVNKVRYILNAEGDDFLDDTKDILEEVRSSFRILYQSLVNFEIKTNIPVTQLNFVRTEKSQTIGTTDRSYYFDQDYEVYDVNHSGFSFYRIKDVWANINVDLGGDLIKDYSYKFMSLINKRDLRFGNAIPTEHYGFWEIINSEDVGTQSLRLHALTIASGSTLYYEYFPDLNESLITTSSDSLETLYKVGNDLIEPMCNLAAANLSIKSSPDMYQGLINKYTQQLQGLLS